MPPCLLPAPRDSPRYPTERKTPAAHLIISDSTSPLPSRTPAWWRSKTIRPVFSVSHIGHCWPKLQKTKSGHPEDVRFSMARQSATGTFRKDHMSVFWGEVESSGRPFFPPGTTESGPQGRTRCDGGSYGHRQQRKGFPLPSNQPFPAPYRATSTQAGPEASRWLAT